MAWEVAGSLPVVGTALVGGWRRVLVGACCPPRGEPGGGVAVAAAARGDDEGVKEWGEVGALVGVRGGLARVGILRPPLALRDLGEVGVRGDGGEVEARPPTALPLAAEAGEAEVVV